VWTLIAYWQVATGDVQRMAQDYELPPRAVEAAIAYYERNRVLIGDRIAASMA
jgi:uncharacterized protein (DUF433 family)